ncbi:MAG TPA: SBBP repeat-containing protein [Pyrinomonadaceae bacterium]|nr:SBBP repeat-containing protein [Pyrinomonadaceae bacterium]
MSPRLQRPYRHIYSLLAFVATLSLIVVSVRFPTIRAFAQDQTPRPVSDQSFNRSQSKPTEPRDAYGALPLSFELNQGQTDGQVKFLARSSGYLLFLTPTEVVMALENPEAHGRGKETREARRSVDESGRREQRSIQPDRVVANEDEPRLPRSIVRMKLVGANPSPLVEGLDQLSTTTNYFAGSDPAEWRTNIPTFNRVRYSEVYPGIDMVYYGDQRRLEYDFVVTPGADPSVIELAFKGIKNYEITYEGDLVLRTSQGDIRQSKPFAYQEVNGVKKEVSAGYVPNGVGRLGFQLGDYDPARPLIIDPVLVYSSYLGGSGFDQGYAIAADQLGNAYVTGRTAAIDFPTTAGALQTNYGGGDAFIAKLNPAGTALIYSTYLNGASGNGIAVDSAGSAYVTGDAYTTNFPTTVGAFQTVPTGFDVFVTKLNPSGSALDYSSRFGGNLDDFGRGIALDAGGNAYITGWTSCQASTCTFPTVNAFQAEYAGGINDAFVTKIDSTGSALVYSTYLGGGDFINATEDWGEAIAVDNAGSAYVTGYTYSPDFPVTAGAFDRSRAGLDAFVTKFAPNGRSVAYSTFLGGPGRELGMGIAVDSSGNAYVTGITESSDNPFTSVPDGFPVTAGAFQTRGSFDAFVTKLNPNGSGLVYSTYLGGNQGVDRGWAIAIDNAGNAYVTGDTTSNTFPTANAIQSGYGGGLSDAFVTKVNASGSALVFSTFLGGSLTDEGRGIALGGNGAFATGDTSSSNFPTANPLQPNNGGGLNNHDDAFVVKIGDVGSTPTPTPTPTATPTPGPSPTPAPSLSSLTLSPTSVLGGNSAVGTITLSAAAPTGGAVVTLMSSNGAIAVVPQSVIVAAGASSASFSVSTKQVSAITSVTISAVYGGPAKTALLTVNAIDKIAIQRADYFRSAKLLRVEATSTEPTAMLRVYLNGNGALIGTLTNNGGGNFSGNLSWQNKPKSITVRSNFGGSASKSVTLR